MGVSLFMEQFVRRPLKVSGLKKRLGIVKRRSRAKRSTAVGHWKRVKFGGFRSNGVDGEGSFKLECLAATAPRFSAFTAGWKEAIISKGAAPVFCESWPPVVKGGHMYLFRPSVCWRPPAEVVLISQWLKELDLAKFKDIDLQGFAWEMDRFWGDAAASGYAMRQE